MSERAKNKNGNKKVKKATILFDFFEEILTPNSFALQIALLWLKRSVNIMARLITTLLCKGS
jgi:hypothetical protein